MKNNLLLVFETGSPRVLQFFWKKKCSYPRLESISQSSCFSFPSVGITGMPHNTWQLCYVKILQVRNLALQKLKPLALATEISCWGNWDLNSCFNHFVRLCSLMWTFRRITQANFVLITTCSNTIFCLVRIPHNVTKHWRINSFLMKSIFVDDFSERPLS